MNGTIVGDRLFKAVILTFLFLSVLIQIMVSIWFYEKLSNMENRLSLYPVNKPVEVDLKVKIPELVEIDDKIDRLTQRLGKELDSPKAHDRSKKVTKGEALPKRSKKKSKPRGSTQVDVVEKIGN
jgi:hypothetical protein